MQGIAVYFLGMYLITKHNELTNFSYSFFICGDYILPFSHIGIVFM